MSLWIILLFYVGASLAVQCKDFYTAGVVEFRPTIQGQTSAQMVAEHTQAYIDILQSAEAKDTDIVIFPEGTLNNALQLTYVPAPEQNVILCPQSSNTISTQNDLEYAEFLIQLSCAARQVAKYVVINLTEKEICTVNAAHDPRPCAPNGLNIYNTNVVFDRQGRIISRYRKVHVYVEQKNTTYEPELAIFETDFGVRFGHFICFDMLFYTPAQELVEKYGIKDFIFPSMFYSELPFLTAVQLQQAWAWGNNVNLLAAGASYPQSGITGTGIFAGNKGALVAAMVGNEGVRQLWVAKVPKTGHSCELEKEEDDDDEANEKPLVTQTGVQMLKDPQIEQFTSELIDFSTTTAISRRLCMLDLCCQFNLKVAHDTPTDNRVGAEHYKYRLGVFKGSRSYEKQEWSNIGICALYACTNESVISCGEIFGPDVQVRGSYAIKSMTIEGDFKKANKLLIMPNSLDTQFYSLQTQQVEWEVSEKGSVYQAKYRLKKSSNNLLAFGIYANYYDNSATTGVVSITGLVGILMILFTMW